MNEIKNLANELREHIKKNNGQQKEMAIRGGDKESPISKKGSTEISNKNAESLVALISSFQINGKEKLMIRMDGETVKFLKQLKLATGIDMIQFIVFCIDNFLESHPQLKTHIKKILLENLK